MTPDLVAVIAYTVMCMIALLFVRVQVVYRISIRGLDLLHEYLRAEISAGRCRDSRKIAELYERLEQPTYNAMVLAPFIWTPRQAYPWLFELIVRKVA